MGHILSAVRRSQEVRTLEDMGTSKFNKIGEQGLVGWCAGNPRFINLVSFEIPFITGKHPDSSPCSCRNPEVDMADGNKSQNTYRHTGTLHSI